MFPSLRIYRDASFRDPRRRSRSQQAIEPASIHAQPVLVKKGWIVDGALQQTLNSKTNHDGDAFTLAEKNTFFNHNPSLKGGIADDLGGMIAERERSARSDQCAQCLFAGFVPVRHVEPGAANTGGLSARCEVSWQGLR